MKLFTLITIPLLMCFASCVESPVAKTVENSLAWVTSAGSELNVVGHKDTIIDDLEIMLLNGTVVKMGKYQSVANAAAIAGAVALDRERMAYLNLISVLLGEKINAIIPTPPADPSAFGAYWREVFYRASDAMKYPLLSDAEKEI